MKKSHFLILMFYIVIQAKAQPDTWTYKDPIIRIHFGTGNIREVNTVTPYHYQRVGSSCPTDGHYCYTSYTSDCFGGDWFTLTEDHTPGDVRGNMLLVNSSYDMGAFFRRDINGFTGGVHLRVFGLDDECL